MKLTIVIPALNEEGAIASIIERCLAARFDIVRRSPVNDVDIVVVSDGSTDRTAEIARRFADREPSVRLIVFGHNRGYGAAIKAGFEQCDAELVGFLDADGTCDPVFFVELCNALIDEHADVALGARLGPDSRMPLVRRIGNRVYATVLSALSNRVVTDTASGMRVIRRAALPRLYPLPDGLHFTPAMTARVLMDESLQLIERPMSYEERIGESKLHVLRDGVRFARTILHMTLMWRPQRLFLLLTTFCILALVLLAMHPIETWLATGRLREDMIYRLLFCSLLGSLAAGFLGAAAITQNLHRLLQPGREPRRFTAALLDGAFSHAGLAYSAVAASLVLAWLVGHGLVTWVADGFVREHWSRVVLAGMIAAAIAQQAVTVLIVDVLRFHAKRGTAADAVVGKRRSARAESIAQTGVAGAASPPIAIFTSRGSIAADSVEPVA